MALVHKSKNKHNPALRKQELRNWITYWHTEIGYSVECQATNESLGRLSFQEASRKLVTKDSFQAKHDGFSQRANMVAKIILPLLPSMFANVTQVFISLETCLL